jgi:hypothetical protein
VPGGVSDNRGNISYCFGSKRLILGWIQLPQYKCHNCCET